jgi:uncharacterized protein involved in response to NO
MKTWNPGSFPAAPHRMLFVAGMLAATTGGLWWAAELVGRLWPAWMLPVAVAPIWAHAWIMVFGLLGPFIFGFLFTTFPRWQNAPEVGRQAYIPVFLSLVVSLGLVLWGAVGSPAVLLAGVVIACLAWIAAVIVLLQVMRGAKAIVSHGIVTAAAIGFATLSQACFAIGLWRDDADLMHLALQAALWGGLLPLVFAVCHRMIPFFTQSAVPLYKAFRPTWWLVTVSLLYLAHVVLAVTGANGWLWLADVPLAALTLHIGLQWQPLRSRPYPLLWTLYVAYFWLPLGLGLQSVADVSFALTGERLLGRAPLHALGIGFLSSLLLAMASRVTLGHSGRKLVMDRFTVACFLSLQAAALLRMCSEVLPVPAFVLPLIAASALVWTSGMFAWSARYGKMLILPRIDGRPG